ADWWIQFMARTPLSTEIGFVGTINFSENPGDLPRLKAATLVIVTRGSSHASVSETEAWVKTIPKATLKVLEGDSFHSAATDPDECARSTLDFIERHPAQWKIPSPSRGGLGWGWGTSRYTTPILAFPLRGKGVFTLVVPGVL